MSWSFGKNGGDSGLSSTSLSNNLSMLNDSLTEIGHVSALGSFNFQKSNSSFNLSWSIKSILLITSITGILIFLIFEKSFSSFKG